MDPAEPSHDTAAGTRLSGREVTVVLGASGLLAINVLVMYLLAVSPLVSLNAALFSVPIIGVLVYGAGIAAGQKLAERGLEASNVGLGVAGMVLLQFVFGLFGAGVIGFVPRASQLRALVLTAGVTAIVTAIIAGYVYARSSTFEHWRTISNYAFIGGVVAIAIGTFVQSVLVVGFLLIFGGFLFRLGWEIWRVRDHYGGSTALQTIGVYVAVAGVFVHILQLVVRVMARR